MKIPFLTNYIDKRVAIAFEKVGLAVQVKDTFGDLGQHCNLGTYRLKDVRTIIHQEVDNYQNKWEFREFKDGILEALNMEPFIILEKSGYRKKKKKSKAKVTYNPEGYAWSAFEQKWIQKGRKNE